MAEVTGVVETIEPKDKGGAKVILRTENDQTRTVHFASNYEAGIPSVGTWGKFTFNEWKHESWGADRSAMKMVESFESVTPPAMNGAAPISTPPQGRTSDLSAATMVMSYAKDIVCHLISVGAVKEIADADTYWLSLFNDGMTALKQAQE